MQPRSILSSLLLSVVAAITFCGATTTLKAQGLPCYPDMCGAYYSTLAYNYTPVLFSYMPYETMIQYIIMDSIISHCRETYPTYADQANFINGLTADNDTFNYALKYLYRMQDYNPILFYNFLNTRQTTKRHPRTLYDDFVKRVGKVGGLPKQEVLKADYILHLRVNETEIITYVAKEAPDNPKYNTDLVVAYAKDIELIKGQILPSNSDAVIVREVVDSTGKRSYQNQLLSTPSVTSNFIFTFTKGRAATPIANQEYIVFASMVGICAGDGTQYYESRPILIGRERGIYKIENGMVIDHDNELGWGTSVPLNEFKANLQGLIDSIKNYGE